MRRIAEDKLNYPWTDQTRFNLRLEYADGGDIDPATIRFVEDIRTLEEAQIAYAEARDATGLGGSRFMPGDVHDEKGDHIARIAYNGRLFRPEILTAGLEVIAEAPALPGTDETLIWMVGTRDSVLEDAYTRGPDNSPQVLKLQMEDGEILVGKHRNGNVMEVLERRPDGFHLLKGGLDDLRPDPCMEP